MTYKCVLTVAVGTAEIPSPTGVAAGKIRFSISDVSNVAIATQEVDGLEATFTALPDGNFTASAQQLDANGAPLGEPVTTTFVDAVETPPATVTFLPLSTLSAAVSVEGATASGNQANQNNGQDLGLPAQTQSQLNQTQAS